MLKRWLSGALGAMALANGGFMLGAGARWYALIPGVASTGPYNPHFVQDIGAAFLAGGLGLLARAWRPRYWPAALAGAGFFGLHALIHVWGLVTGHVHDLAVEIGLVIVPSALALWAALPDAGDAHA